MAYKELTVGQVGTVHWSNSYHDLQAKAEIVKINQKTVKAKLLEDVVVMCNGRSDLTWFKGHVITVPAPGYETTLNKFEYDPTET